MKRQLAAIHPGIEQITDYYGSPTFESTKGYQSPFSRDTFLESLSLSKDDVYILYMCSSPSIGGHNEDRVIAELISTLSRAGILTGNVHLVVRTHPLLNLKDSPIFNNPPLNVIFYPKDSTSPNLSSNANDVYLSTILYSNLVIGQNTSAFLDVCLLDRPCITLPEYPGLYNPSKFGHIELLLEGKYDSVVSVIPNRDIIIRINPSQVSVLNPGRFEGLTLEHEQLYKVNPDLFVLWSDLLRDNSLLGDNIGYIDIS